jgi:predicted permease
MRWLTQLFARRRRYDELSASIREHLDERIADLMDSGMTRDEAETAARREFGNVTRIEERSREVWQWPKLESIWADMKFALRQLRKSPGFAITAILTLALGIGANTAIFSVVDAVLLRPLPYRNASRLVVVWQTDAAHRGTGAWFDPYREFELWQRGSRSFEKLAAMSWATEGKTLVWHGKPVGILALPTSTDFFSMLGAKAQFGRTFSQTDLNNPCTLVLAYPFWREKLGAPEDIVGKSLTMDRSACVVVGVMPKNFMFYPKQTNAWSLIGPTSAFVQKPWDSMTGVFGLLKPGVTRAQAQAELTAMEKRVQPEAPASLALLRSSTPTVLNLQDNFTWLAGRDLRVELWVLLGAVVLILIMACLNVANLLLGRAVERSREMAVRAALGSGRGRLIRQMLTESLMLALCGTGTGILLAMLIVHWFRSVNPVELPPGSVVSLDWQVLLFAAVLGVGSAILFGLFPAWRAARIDLNFVLKNGDRGIVANASAQRVSQTLVMLQIALSLMLFVGTGLLAASLWRMASIPLGYRTEHVLTATVHLPKTRYASAESKSRFAAALGGKVSAQPGVEAATEASGFTPMGESPLSIEGISRFSAGGIATQSVSTNFFDTMQIAVLRGRSFDTRDRNDTQPVAIINEALANRYFPHINPIGRAIKLSRADDPSYPWLTIVGVAANIRTTTVFQAMGYIEQPAVYRPLTQDAPASLTLMVVTKGKPLGMVGGIEEQLASIDRGLILGSVETMKSRQSAVLSQPRFRTALFGSFAVLALMLAVVGIYGILAQTVAQRRREIAIRMALGASRRTVVLRVFRETFVMVSIGIAFGIVGSAITVRALIGLLYEVRAENVAIFALGSVLSMLTALVAGWNPARRAASVDPMQALRSE